MATQTSSFAFSQRNQRLIFMFEFLTVDLSEICHRLTKYLTLRHNLITIEATFSHALRLTME